MKVWKWIAQYKVSLQWVALVLVFFFGQMRSEHAVNEAKDAAELVAYEKRVNEYTNCLATNVERQGVYNLVGAVIAEAGATPEEAEAFVALAQDPDVLPQLECGPEPRP